MAKDYKEFKIDGCIVDKSNTLTEDQFLDKFIEWLESEGLQFGGGFEDITDKEE